MPDYQMMLRARTRLTLVSDVVQALSDGNLECQYPDRAVPVIPVDNTDIMFTYATLESSGSVTIHTRINKEPRREWDGYYAWYKMVENKDEYGDIVYVFQQRSLPVYIDSHVEINAMTQNWSVSNGSWILIGERHRRRCRQTFVYGDMIDVAKAVEGFRGRYSDSDLRGIPEELRWVDRVGAGVASLEPLPPLDSLSPRDFLSPVWLHWCSKAPDDSHYKCVLHCRPSFVELPSVLSTHTTVVLGRAQGRIVRSPAIQIEHWERTFRQKGQQQQNEADILRLFNEALMPFDQVIFDSSDQVILSTVSPAPGAYHLFVQNRHTGMFEKKNSTGGVAEETDRRLYRKLSDFAPHPTVVLGARLSNGDLIRTPLMDVAALMGSFKHVMSESELQSVHCGLQWDHEPSFDQAMMTGSWEQCCFYGKHADDYVPRIIFWNRHGAADAGLDAFNKTGINSGNYNESVLVCRLQCGAVLRTTMLSDEHFENVSHNQAQSADGDLQYLDSAVELQALIETLGASNASQHTNQFNTLKSDTRGSLKWLLWQSMVLTGSSCFGILIVVACACERKESQHGDDSSNDQGDHINVQELIHQNASQEPAFGMVEFGTPTKKEGVTELTRDDVVFETPNAVRKRENKLQSSDI